MNKKVGVLAVFLSLIPFATAAIGDTLRSILLIGDINYLGLTNDQILTALVRILIWIMVFALFYALASRLKIFGEKKNIPIVIALCIATISAIFLPGELILLTGGGFATIVSFMLIGGPVIGIGYIMFQIPHWLGGYSRGAIFIQLVLAVFLFWILSVIKFHLQRLL